MEVREYLKEAKSAIIDLNDKKKELKALKDKEESLRKNLSNLEKKQSDCIIKTIKDKENELLKQYETLYSQAEKVVREKEEVRSKAKNEKVKAIVEEGTAGIKEECKKIKEELKQKMKDEKIPFFVNTKLFYSLFMPKMFSDFVLMFLVLIAVAVGIPYFIYRHYKFTEPIWLVVFIIAAIFIYGCLILLIDHLVVEKKRDAIRDCSEIRKEYIMAKKTVSKKADRIRKDIKDDQLALDTYDYDIKKAKEDSKRVIEEKDLALKQFHEVMEDKIKQEVILAAKNDFDEIETKIIDNKNELAKIEEEYTTIEQGIREKYEAELGKDIMSERAINNLIDKVNNASEEITTIEQAKALLKK